MNTTDRNIRQQEMIIERANTSHILHLLLTLLTGGLWLIMWVLISLSNASARSSANSKINMMIKSYDKPISADYQMAKNWLGARG